MHSPEVERNKSVHMFLCKVFFPTFEKFRISCLENEAPLCECFFPHLYSCNQDNPQRQANKPTLPKECLIETLFPCDFKWQRVLYLSITRLISKYYYDGG